MYDRHPLYNLGDFPIYNLMGGLGLIIAVLLLIRNLKRLNISEKKQDNLLVALAIIFLASLFFANFINWFVIPGVMNYSWLDRFKAAGLTYYFGLLPFLVLSLAYLKWAKYPVLPILDTLVPSILIFHAWGRAGCSLIGCCYGKVINLSLFGFLMERFPSAEVESILLFVLFYLAQFRIRKNKLLFFLLTYPSVRFLLEYTRADVRGAIIGSSLSPAQEISLLLFLIGCLYIFVAKLKLPESSD
ncbi:MAG: prolipoprotein diacylglyceryl transferase family protein [Syntrophomonadaceae bacterium]